MPNYGVISDPYFPVFGLNTGKHGPEITQYLDTFHAVQRKMQNEKKPNLKLKYFQNLDGWICGSKE